MKSASKLFILYSSLFFSLQNVGHPEKLEVQRAPYRPPSAQAHRGKGEQVVILKSFWHMEHHLEGYEHLTS